MVRVELRDRDGRLITRELVPVLPEVIVWDGRVFRADTQSSMRGSIQNTSPEGAAIFVEAQVFEVRPESDGRGMPMWPVKSEWPA